MWTVYMHTCKVNNKKYIGITCQVPYYARFNGNGSGYKTSVRFWNAIQKYGWENFEHTILAENISKEEAHQLEREYIKLYKTEDDNYGYNIKEGGQGERLPQSVKDKISKSHVGKPGTTTGRKHTEEEIRKISEAQKSQAFTPEHLANLRQSLAKFRDQPTRYMPTKEQLEKLAERSKIKVRCIETGQIFDSMSDAASWLGVLISNMSRAIKDNRAYKGYHFEKCS